MSTEIDVSKPSFRRGLIEDMKRYGLDVISGPIVIEGQSLSYVRAIVSSFNTDNNTTYSVYQNKNKLLVGTRSDCRNYKDKPALPAYESLSGRELMALAVESLRGQGLGGQEIESVCKENLNDNDYLL